MVDLDDFDTDSNDRNEPIELVFPRKANVARTGLCTSNRQICHPSSFSSRARLSVPHKQYHKSPLTVIHLTLGYVIMVAFHRYHASAYHKKAGISFRLIAYLEFPGIISCCLIRWRMLRCIRLKDDCSDPCGCFQSKEV